MNFNNHSHTKLSNFGWAYFSALLSKVVKSLRGAFPRRNSSPSVVKCLKYSIVLRYKTVKILCRKCLTIDLRYCQLSTLKFGVKKNHHFGNFKLEIFKLLEKRIW